VSSLDTGTLLRGGGGGDFRCFFFGPEAEEDSFVVFLTETVGVPVLRPVTGRCGGGNRGGGVGCFASGFIFLNALTGRFGTGIAGGRP